MQCSSMHLRGDTNTPFFVEHAPLATAPDQPDHLEARGQRSG